ncbi:MAG: tRNA pseudouridine(38-40) synthase TruA [Pseudoxanthomonas sp.]|nr:tRNA pseudouridine(38-40) synthase TruA [Pseudoxanthomonas sp.]
MTATPLPDRQRIALAVEYDGSGYSGWQRLAHTTTVQATLEAVLSRVAAEPVETTCAGRTDAGVHARAQVVHFDTTARRSPRGWMLGSNGWLPDTVAVVWAGVVPAQFHARFHARRRRYRYCILNRDARPGLQGRFLTWEHHRLDHAAMDAAAAVLVGRHDFSAFRALACQARHAMRTVHEVSVRRDGDLVVLEIEANAFLHHMVRNIVGSLLLVGRGRRPQAWIAELLAGRRREPAGPTAPPEGLTFLGPRYPRGLGLPPWLECDDPL